jgi:Single-stranded DNA-binding replication protein A (RPA), large (70 kD) subunit and related ssDNA-binding proteins
MELREHAEALASSLGEDTEEVLAELEGLLQYHVPLEEAKQSIRRARGADGGGGGPAVERPIGGISVDDDRVSVVGRVQTLGRRRIRSGGDETVLREGLLADESGSVTYTAWADCGFAIGDVIAVDGASVREWNGRAELNINGPEQVTKVDDDRVSVEPLDAVPIAEIRPGDRGLTVEVRVTDLEARDIDGRSGPTTIWSGVVGDASGRAPVTDWAHRDTLAEGASVRMEEVSIREFRGVPQVSLSEFSSVTPIDEVSVRTDAETVTIGGALAAGGRFDVETVGNVLEVRDGSGLIERCPECGRLVQNEQCRAHGAVDGVDDLRVKAIIDDGTGAMTAIFGTELTATLYGADLEDALSAARDAMDRGVVSTEIDQAITGHRMAVRGDISVDEYGATCNVRSMQRDPDDAVDRAAALLAEVGT